MLYENILQYNPEIFGDRVNQVPVEELRYKFVARGISKILSQMDELQKIFMWVGMVSKTPIGQRINWEKIGEMSVRLINQDPKELLMGQGPQEVGQGPTPPEQEQQQQLLQLMQQGGK
jgi:hypothetical protein